MIVKLKHSSGNWDEEVDGSMSVLDLKALLSCTVDIEAHHQRLIYKGRVLKDDQTLEGSGAPRPLSPPSLWLASTSAHLRASGLPGQVWLTEARSTWSVAPAPQPRRRLRPHPRRTPRRPPRRIRLRHRRR